MRRNQHKSPLWEEPESYRLQLVFGHRVAYLIMKAYKEDRLERVFGRSAAMVINLIAKGAYPGLADRSKENKRIEIEDAPVRGESA